MIPKLVFRGETLINIPADKQLLEELGLSESEANNVLDDYQTGGELDKIRAYRAPRLVEADYLVNIAMDKELDIAPFRIYRESLRDITEHEQVFSAVVWPEKPELPTET
ncbi:hypothetical protein HQQ94_05410 [Shewanella sp. VB17]|uniref:phage tail assembly chaperone n=1 Tax=Shewanella sp. VB17 TaxID=2739432 RepID=UPI001567342F|nr:phage tail assembly chaperone [Shewanella sp. VB17]NRD72694.1 hypothetical protein [Shewanella sp. VB17]